MQGVKFDHIALGLHKIHHAAPVLSAFRCKPSKGGSNERFSGCQWKFVNNATLETLEPASPTGTEFLNRFLELRGPGIHHVTFLVPSIREGVERAKALNYNVVDFNEKKPHWKEAFLHPKDCAGIVVQMAEFNPELAPKSEEEIGWSSEWKGFNEVRPAYNWDAEDKNKTDAVEMLGLLMRVKDDKKVVKQFSALLGAKETPIKGGIEFRWEESPMFIRAIFEENREKDGPHSILLRSNSPIANLSTIATPQIGASFEQVDK